MTVHAVPSGEVSLPHGSRIIGLGEILCLSLQGSIEAPRVYPHHFHPNLCEVECALSGDASSFSQILGRPHVASAPVWMSTISMAFIS